MNPVFKQSILKIIQDKLFIGLLLVGLLTVFIGFGASNKSNDDDKDEKQKAKSAYRITKTQADGGAENGNECGNQKKTLSCWKIYWLKKPKPKNANTPDILLKVKAWR